MIQILDSDVSIAPKLIGFYAAYKMGRVPGRLKMTLKIPTVDMPEDLVEELEDPSSARHEIAEFLAPSVGDICYGLGVRYEPEIDGLGEVWIQEVWPEAVTVSLEVEVSWKMVAES